MRAAGLLSRVACNPPQLWGLCLEMVDVAGYSDPEYVRQLWDVHLKAAVDAAGQPGGSFTRFRGSRGQRLPVRQTAVQQQGDGRSHTLAMW